MAAIIQLLGGIRATIFAGLALLLAVVVGFQNVRNSHVLREFDGYKAKMIAATAKAAEDAKRVQAAVTTLQAGYYEQRARGDDNFQAGRESAIHAQEVLITDLRSSNVRLRREWRGCVSGPSQYPAVGSAEPATDADADLRATGAGHLVGAADLADNQIRGLQAQSLTLWDYANKLAQACGK